MIRRAACLLIVLLGLICGIGACAEETGEKTDCAGAFAAYEFSMEAFEPVPVMEYSAGDGSYDLAVSVTGVDESGVSLRLENKGENSAYFSFSQYILDGLAVYDYHEWKIPSQTVMEEKIEIREDILRWAGMETVGKVTFSTPAFSTEDGPLLTADTAEACIGEEAKTAPRPAGMELLSGDWGRLSLIGVDYRDIYSPLVFRLDNEQPSWTLEWARGVTFYSYLNAEIQTVSVNGEAVEDAANLSQNWECSTIGFMYLDSLSGPVDDIDEIRLSIRVTGSGEEGDFDETVEIEVCPDPEQLVILR